MFILYQEGLNSGTMKLLQNILVPLDFRESSVNAFKYAAKVSEVFNSNLIVMHVIADRSMSAETEELLLSTVRHRYEELAAMVDPVVSARMELVVQKGVIFEQIVKVAIKRDINVIIAGSGSEVENDRYRLSTILEKLMRKNQVPLWVVRSSDSMPVRKILCPVDFSDASGRAFHNAITLASFLKAELTVLNVFTSLSIQSPRLQVDNEQENKILRKRQQKEFSEFLSGFDTGQVSFKELFLEGVPEKVIRSAVSSGGFDLLIMGTTGRTGLSRILMGSVTEKVTREVPCSFITTKSKDIARTYFESNLGEIETYIQKARQYREEGNYERAIEFFTAGLKQFPDNIPMLTGLMETYRDSGNEVKAAFFRDYAQDVVKRVWGEEYVKKLGLE